MFEPLNSISPLVEERDGKIYYIGPVRTPDIIMPNDGLTPEQRGEVFNIFAID